MSEPEIITIAGERYRVIERTLVTSNAGEGAPYRYTAEYVEAVGERKG